jgi:hypothetical protein
MLIGLPAYIESFWKDATTFEKPFIVLELFG